jgi:hypothetical protein
VFHLSQSKDSGEYLHSNFTQGILHSWNASSATILKNEINSPNWGQPIRKDGNVSSLNTTQILIKMRSLKCVWCGLLKGTLVRDF